MKVLIVGSGNQGALADAQGSGNEYKVISFAHAFKERNADITFLDMDNDKAKKAAELWNYNYVTYGSMLIGYDIVVIATPDEKHFDWLLMAICSNPKVKLIICEKPLCSTVKEAKDILCLYEQNNIPILVDYTRRFIPKFQEHIGKTIAYAHCYFNRGWLHTATHGIDLFNMYNQNSESEIRIREIKSDKRFWDIFVKFTDGSILEDTRIGDMPVDSCFDYHTRYVINNAYNFLEGKEELKCTAKDGLKALEILEKLEV